jgi:hypothetical protein
VYVDTPIALVLSTTIQPPWKHFHAFGCPMYQVNSFLRGGKTNRMGATN